MCLNVKGNDSETIHKDTCFREGIKNVEGVWKNEQINIVGGQCININHPVK